MSNDPFTIRIFVPDGNPEGIRVIDKMNWTGKGIAFPRDKWNEARPYSDLDQAGVYILFGYTENTENEDDLPTIYIGEGDGIRSRLDSHYGSKDFWSLAIVFVSTNRGLNKAHVQWLEYSLVKRAKEIGQCKLDNGNTPQEPGLTDSEKADTRGFLREILQILPLLGVKAFETPRVISTSSEIDKPVIGLPSSEFDTIVVPARIEGFKETFLGENCWYAIRISAGKLPKIRWIAGYQKSPVGAITHVAPVDHIEPYGDENKYKVVFSEAAKPIGPIPMGDAPPVIMMSPKYTSYARLMKAKKLMDLFDSVAL